MQPILAAVELGSSDPARRESGCKNIKISIQHSEFIIHNSLKTVRIWIAKENVECRMLNYEV